MRVISPSFLIWQESGRRNEPSPRARGSKPLRFGPTTWPIGAPIAPYKPAKTSLLYPRQARFFLAPLTFSPRLSRSESSVWHPLAHETVHFSINQNRVFFPDPIRTYLPYLARPRAHHDHQHPMQPTKPPEAWTNKDRDARKSTTKKRMGPKAGIGDQTRSS